MTTLIAWQFLIIDGTQLRPYPKGVKSDLKTEKSIKKINKSVIQVMRDGRKDRIPNTITANTT